MPNLRLPRLCAALALLAIPATQARAGTRGADPSWSFVVGGHYNDARQEARSSTTVVGSESVQQRWKGGGLVLDGHVAVPVASRVALGAKLTGSWSRNVHRIDGSRRDSEQKLAVFDTLPAMVVAHPFSRDRGRPLYGYLTLAVGPTFARGELMDTAALGETGAGDRRRGWAFRLSEHGDCFTFANGPVVLQLAISARYFPNDADAAPGTTRPSGLWNFGSELALGFGGGGPGDRHAKRRPRRAKKKGRKKRKLRR